jgi:8-oxo-dGTP pyrophosphatase MutT (NUDIX family)
MNSVKKRKNGAFVVMLRNRATEVFLVLRSDTKIWNLPGGGIEPNETPSKTMLREAKEETGFVVRDYQYLGVHHNIDRSTGKTWNYAYLFSTINVSGGFKPEFPGCKGKWFKINALPSGIQYITVVRIRVALRPVSDTPFEEDFVPPEHVHKKYL